MLFLYILIGLAIGQESSQVKYQKQTEIDFDGLDIIGEMVKPQGSLIAERSTAKFNPLIQLRTDWNVEMSLSVTFIK